MEGEKIGYHIHPDTSQNTVLGQFSRKKTKLALYFGATYLKRKASLSSEVLDT